MNLYGHAGTCRHANILMPPNRINLGQLVICQISETTTTNAARRRALNEKKNINLEYSTLRLTFYIVYLMRMPSCLGSAQA